MSELLATDDNMGYILMMLGANDELAVDTEGSGLNMRNKVDYLMGFSFSVEGMDCYIPFRHKSSNVSMRWLENIENLLIDKDLVWHNLKFDMHACKTIGIDPLKWNGKHYDTMMLAHLLDEEMYSKELDFLGRKFLGEGKKKDTEFHKLGQVFGYNNITPEAAYEYAGTDTRITRGLKRIFWPRIQQEELESVYWETELPFLKLLYQLEQRGVGVDLDFAAEKAKRGRGRMESIARELHINPASTKDLEQYLLNELNLPILEHTPSCEECKKRRPVTSHEWRPSFNKKVMEEYDSMLEHSNNPAARRVAEFRGWQKATTSLYEPILNKVGPDGLIRTEFKQHGTVTGRLSASNPNLQQVPRGSEKPWNGDAKSAFNSGRSGASLYGWDYSQLELRLAAAYGMESILLTEFERERSDPFAVLAPLIFGVLTPETRHDTKTFVYANLYGAGLNKIAWQLGRDPEEVRPLFQNYKNSISNIINVSEQVALLIKQRKFVKYWDGRRRHMRNTDKAYKAWNSVVQGGGAQLVKKAMLRLLEVEDANFFMVMQVHDEITCVVETSMIPKYEPYVIEAMTDWPQFPVHFHVEGKEWGKKTA